LTPSSGIRSTVFFLAALPVRRSFCAQHLPTAFGRRFLPPNLPYIALAALRQPDQPDPTFPAWLSSPLSTNPN
jgi:hypothetical protein